MPESRAIDAKTAEAIARVRRELRGSRASETIPLPVLFPAANTDLDVAHELGQVPDGYEVVEADGPVCRRPGLWADKDRVYLRSTVAGTRGTVILFTLRETRNEA